MSTINGIGITYFGQSAVKADGSYITTKWFCLVFPVIPLGSYRIWPQSSRSYLLGMYSSATFRAKRVSLYLPHVLKVYGIYAAFYVFLLLADRLGTGEWHF